MFKMGKREQTARYDCSVQGKGQKWQSKGERESSDERIRWERKKASVMVKKREQRGKGRQGGREEVSWISGAVLQRDTSAF